MAGVHDAICLDAGVWVKFLVAEEWSSQAVEVVASASRQGRIVAPAFCWAEVGSVLRKKARSGEITVDESAEAWADFQLMRIEYLDEPAIRQRAWILAGQFGQSTLYNTAYLACTEAVDATSRTFWTADDALLAALGDSRPPYVRHLRDWPGG